MVGRVGAAPAALPERRLHVKRLRLGRESRKAFRMTSENPLRVVVARPARHILLSVGLRGRIDPEASVHFSVRARTPDGWRSVFSRSVDTAEKWQDRLVSLEAFPSGPTEFEFETRLPEAGPELRAYFGSVVFSGAADETEEARPNVVLVSLDTLGAAYLGAERERDAASPSIDRVLRGSGSFSRAYAQYGSTLLSHEALFTGRYPRSARSPHERKRNIPTLVQRIASQGYLTLAVTENGYVSSAYGFAKGFDWYDDGPLATSGEGRTRTLAVSNLEQLQRLAPLFLFVHTYEVHKPYQPRSAAARELAARLTPRDPRSYWEVRARGDEDWRSSRDVRRMRALYIGGIRDLDAQVEQFFSRLAAQPAADETLVVLTSDHGEEFREGHVGHGGLHNDVLRVPLGFHWPGRIPARTHGTPVELVDVLPTLLDFARVPAPEGLDGRSLAPLLLTGEDSPGAPNVAFSLAAPASAGCEPGACTEPGYALQSERFKLTRRHGPGSERLYDLERDPGESMDVARRHPLETQRPLRLLESRADALGGAQASAGEGEIDSHTRERLRALGYIQ